MSYSEVGDILQEIQLQTQGKPNADLLQEALAFGAWGESGWGQNLGNAAAGAGGYFGFTPPSAFGITPAEADTPSTAVAAILPSYEAAVSGTGTPGYRQSLAGASPGIPPGLSGPALAEYMTISAEGPANDIAQMQAILASNSPSYAYGDNTSVNPTTVTETGGLWDQITKFFGPGGSGVVTQSPNGQIGQTPQQAINVAQASEYSNYTNPANQAGFANQASAALTQTMQPVITTQKKDSSGNITSSASGYVKDAINILTFGSIAQAGGPVKLVSNVGQTDVEAVSSITGDPASNIWNVIKSSLVRLGIGLVGLLFIAAGLYIVVTKVSGGAPMPIPV